MQNKPLPLMGTIVLILLILGRCTPATPTPQSQAVSPSTVQPPTATPVQFQATTESNFLIATPTLYLDMWNTFSSPFFAISLEHPADWEPVPGYGSQETGIVRFAGVNGFFQIGSMDSDSIDQAASAEAYHRLQPYGSDPTIETLQIQGQEARLGMKKY